MSHARRMGFMSLSGLHQGVARSLQCAALMWLALPEPAAAQWLSPQTGWGAQVVVEPVIAAYGGFSALCNPSAARNAGWGVDQIVKLINPTSAQRASIDELRAATVKATELPEAACPRQIPRNSRDRMAFLERRLAALLLAIKTISPAFEA